MNAPITGIHHLTAIAGDPQANIDFYAGLLGLRLVKRTVNFDDPSAYHLYYGDETGAPGTIVTFFYWPRHAGHGQIGAGQVSAITLSAPTGSLDFWQHRLQAAGHPVRREARFGEELVALADPDGIPVEIVSVSEDPRHGWTGGVPAAHAIRGLHTVDLLVRQSVPTESLLTGEMGYTLVLRDGNRARFVAPGGSRSGQFVDVIAHASASTGVGGVGTIHHIAWSVPDDAAELLMQERLQNAGFGVSDVRDRDYFRSIYYRERGGILFEIATATPGFAVDEPRETLGTELRLPRQFARYRDAIVKALPPIQPPSVNTSAAA